MIIIAYTIFGVIVLVLAHCHRQIILLRRRLDSALGGTKGDSLEIALKSYFNQANKIINELDKIRLELNRVSHISEHSTQKIAIIRFNPFGDTGGDQSFCLAALNNQDTGYVLTSIHGREGSRIYIKPITKSKSSHPLSEEELKAVNQAISNSANQIKE